MEERPSFGDFVQAVHGWRPFPWQERLAAQAMAGAWPSAIDVSTGLGKTTVLDVAVYCLAASAGSPPDRRAARTRTALIVDRRVVVQGAFEHAARIEKALSDPRHDETRWAATELRRIGSAVGDELTVPLVVQQMRGGVTWESRWVDRPDQPAVVVGTVDQLGSRLLFRGYGLSDRMKPIDAALFGSDTLLFLDEAHLSDALVETIGQLGRFERAAAVQPLAHRRLQVVTMTATPRGRVAVEPLVSDDDRNDPVAEPRLSATKRAVLVDLANSTTPAKAATELGQTMGSLAVELVTRAERRCGVVLVVANTIALARSVHRQLEGAKDRSFDVELVVGRCRTVEREANRDAWWDRAKAGRCRQQDTPALVLVATQTVEVGADLDVDALITEAAPIDALVQRFGRVDRLGELGETESFVVHAAGRLVDGAPPYGAATGRTWGWLCAEAGGAALLDQRSPAASLVGAPTIDFGLLELRERLDQSARRDDLLSVPARPPVVVPEVLAVWRRTAPVPTPDEGVAAYLHGLNRGSPTVSVAWRADAWDGREFRDEDLQDHPPRSNELVEVTLASFRRFLRDAGPSSDESDLEGAPTVEELDRPGASSAEPVRAAVRRGPRWQAVDVPGDVRPGDVVVVASDDGGHDAFGWTAHRGKQTVDVADLVHGFRPTLRIDPRVLRPLCQPQEPVPDGDTIQSVDGVLSAFRDEVQDAYKRADDLGFDLDGEVDRCVHDFIGRLGALAAPNTYGSLLRERLDELDHVRWSLSPSSGHGLVQIGVHQPDRDRQDRTIAIRRLVGPVAAKTRRFVIPADDDDAVQSSIGLDKVALSEHLESVGARADRYGRRLGLTDELISAVRVAGRFHDLGKADVRFQTLLHGGIPWLAESAGSDATALLAKSGSAPLPRRRWRPGEWPIGYRHEAISLALVERAPDDVFVGTDRELVAHLVASHHGHARPLFPPVIDREFRDVEVDFDGHGFRASSDGSHPAWDQVARFERLCDRYGTWGLALLEAIVRLADIAVSEEGG